MGKKHFNELYEDACYVLGLETGTIKLSSFCDDYDPSKNYAGTIFYHHDGNYRWKNTKGVAQGYRCQFLYVLIQCTDEWTGKDFRRQGSGYVHDKMYKDMFGTSYDEKITCCGGFAIMEGKKKYSSIWLNNQSSNATHLPWESDGNKNLSKGEKMIVNLAINEWKKGYKDHVIRISRSTDSKIRSAP